MIDLFETPKIDLTDITCHSGGAEGADTDFSNLSKKFNVKVKAYSYKTSYHLSSDKVEISEEEYNEGAIEINKANKYLRRPGIKKYMSLLARNWSQVKYSTQIFAIGVIVGPGGETPDGYSSKSKIQTVSGGTGYAVMMGILNLKEVFVFDQLKNVWFRWSYSTMSFIKLNQVPKIKTQNFAGIGTRKINENGKKAIVNLFESSFL